MNKWAFLTSSEGASEFAFAFAAVSLRPRCTQPEIKIPYKAKIASEIEITLKGCFHACFQGYFSSTSKNNLSNENNL